MAIQNFTEALMELRRKAQLSGRPLTKQEAAGVAAGYAETSTTRLNQAKQLELQEQEIEQRQTLQTEELAAAKERQAAELAQRKSEQEAQMKAAEEAQSLAKKQHVATTTLAGAGLGYLAASGGAAAGAEAGAEAGTAISPGVGTVIGAVVGAIVGIATGGSYLCTAADKEIGLTSENLATLYRFREYVKQNHPEPLKFYLRIGPELIIKITESENTDIFYKTLIDTLINPVIVYTDSSHEEQAYKLYRNTLGKLIIKYTPHLFDEYKRIANIDNKKFRRAV